MSKPYIHAKNSVRLWGGEVDDYLPLHDFLDSSKDCMPDVRHRVLTHNSWFINNVLEKIFGHTITNSAGREVSVKGIGEQHVSEDFSGRFIPSPQDWIENMELKDWMNNGRIGSPSSIRKYDNGKLSGNKKTVISFAD